MSANVDTEKSAEHESVDPPAERSTAEPAPKTDGTPDDTVEEAPFKALKPTIVTIASVAAAMTVASAFLAGGRTTIAIAIGGLLATLNFILFIRLVAAFLDQKGNSAPWAIVGAVKLVGLFAVVYIILKRGDLPPLGLAMGYGSLPIGISLGTLFKPKPAPKKG